MPVRVSAPVTLEEAATDARLSFKACGVLAYLLRSGTEVTAISQADRGVKSSEGVGLNPSCLSRTRRR